MELRMIVMIDDDYYYDNDDGSDRDHDILIDWWLIILYSRYYCVALKFKNIFFWFDWKSIKTFKINKIKHMNDSYLLNDDDTFAMPLTIMNNTFVFNPFPN